MTQKIENNTRMKCMNIWLLVFLIYKNFQPNLPRNTQLIPFLVQHRKRVSNERKSITSIFEMLKSLQVSYKMKQLQLYEFSTVVIGVELQI